jgi:thiosulfate/3-mercaptopyruvate sulfurtransferase
MLTVAAILFAAAMPVKQEMLVSTDWLGQHLRDPLVVVVEVGDRAQFDAGHIPGARFIAQSEMVADCDGLPNEIPSEAMLVDAFTRAGVTDWKRMVIVSRDPLVAARTWFTLDYLGHGYRASLLDGGMPRWTAEKRAMTTDSPYVAPVPFTVATRPYSVLAGAEVKRLVRNRGTSSQPIVLIDARPPDHFLGKTAGAGVKRSGRIPGAENIPWTANFTGDAAPVLRPSEELRGMYASADVSDDTMVIAYCRTGMQASVTYFVLRYLGYDVALYDGSFVEWSAASDTVVVSDASRRP